MVLILSQPALVLAQNKKIASEVLFWLGIIVVLAFALGFIALWLRKRLIGEREEKPPIGFTLKDLRAMHAAGQLSDEELALAEEKALSKARSHYLGKPIPTHEEPKDIGHLSTGDEDDYEGGTENMSDVSDKNL